MQRMWINQPSTLQPEHNLHGTNVLAEDKKDGDEYYRIWFLSGNVHNQMISYKCLSLGWVARERKLMDRITELALEIQRLTRKEGTTK